jgi:hypothetical protein
MGETGAFHWHVAKHGAKHRVVHPLAVAEFATLWTVALGSEVCAHLPFHYDVLDALQDGLTIRNR